MFILDDLLVWLPLKGLKEIAEKIKYLAEEEHRINKHWEELLQIRRDFKLGLISDQEFQERLSDTIRAMKKKS